MYITRSPAGKRSVVSFPFLKIELSTQPGAEEPCAARDVAPGEC
jgi:hypothetical protein